MVRMEYITHRLRDELRDQVSHTLWRGTVPAIKAIIRALINAGYPAYQAESVGKDTIVDQMIKRQRAIPKGQFVVWRDIGTVRIERSTSPKK